MIFACNADRFLRELCRTGRSAGIIADIAIPIPLVSAPSLRSIAKGGKPRFSGVCDGDEFLLHPRHVSIGGYILSSITILSCSALSEYCVHVRRNGGNAIVHSSRETSCSVANVHRGEDMLGGVHPFPSDQLARFSSYSCYTYLFSVLSHCGRHSSEAVALAIWCSFFAGAIFFVRLSIEFGVGIQDTDRRAPGPTRRRSSH